MPKYNTMFDVAFTVEHDYDDPNDVPGDVLIAALERRIAGLREMRLEEIQEAFGACDTYEIRQG